jgi:hypothetical protein
MAGRSRGGRREPTKRGRTGPRARRQQLEDLLRQERFHDAIVRLARTPNTKRRLEAARDKGIIDDAVLVSCQKSSCHNTFQLIYR